MTTPSQPVTIHNDSAYVKVVHSNGVVVYYVKSNLIIQKLNEKLFMLKNESFMNYYNYDEVAEPVSSDIDDLLSQITSWNTSLSNAFQNLNVNAIYFVRGASNINAQ
jgi:hypothetical protein